jgi:hypothetical protein
VLGSLPSLQPSPSPKPPLPEPRKSQLSAFVWGPRHCLLGSVIVHFFVVCACPSLPPHTHSMRRLTCRLRLYYSVPACLCSPCQLSRHIQASATKASICRCHCFRRRTFGTFMFLYLSFLFGRAVV